ncbi:Lipolytic enzyme, G-D-S-L [Marinomonas sp. MED121]|nr:Lipolytic enzyme, G-D-S-L [Marinomonas sp. MED121]
MGDSLSAAYQLPIEKGWVHLLESHIKQQDTNINIINASISGETTQGGVSRLAPLLKEAPNIVILELGANDALRGYPLKTTKNNLIKMITDSKQAGAKVLLIGNQIPPNYGRRYANAFFTLFQDIAEQEEIPLVPFMLDNVALNQDLMLNDGLHPNAQGQTQVLKNIMPKVLSLLN